MPAAPPTNDTLVTLLARFVKALYAYLASAFTAKGVGIENACLADITQGPRIW